MIEPKLFYRKLDSILTTIGQEKSGKDLIFSIVDELENTFGNDLRIGNGRIYERIGDEYVLIMENQDSPKKVIKKKITVDSQAIQSILKSKTYIFDDPSLTIDLGMSPTHEYSIPAALTVHSPEKRWIFVFELKSGWIREEIEFCLNAVRTAMNSRLFSESIENEMQQAVHIQQSLLPPAPEIEGYEIAAGSIAAELVGGDLYDFFQFDGGDFGFCIGDASGHGLPAALMVRDVVTGLRMGIEKHMKMDYTLKKLNSVIQQSVYSTRFISLFYAEMDHNGNLFYVNAGHPSPVVINGSRHRELESTGLVIGALPEIEISRAYSFIEPGSTLVLYSDGIIERKNVLEQEFGVDSLIQAVKKNQKKNAQEILKAVFDAALNFGKSDKWQDDATLVIVKRLNNAEGND